MVYVVVVLALGLGYIAYRSHGWDRVWFAGCCALNLLAGTMMVADDFHYAYRLIPNAVADWMDAQ